MLAALQQCQHCLAGWSPVVAAAAAAVRVVPPQQLWASAIHTTSSCCQEQHSSVYRSDGEASSSSIQASSSSAVASTSTSSFVQPRPITTKAAAARGKQQTQRLQAIVHQNMSEVPTAARTGDKALLTEQQRESMALFRRFNISQPGLRGQVILAKVLRSTPKYLLVDPGYYGLNVVARQELAAAYDEQGHPLPPRSTINPGEYVKLRLSAFTTPYGDAQLDPVGISHTVRQKLVWEELEYRMRKGLPVKGRILNATARGYAVGVAGYVALLQRSQGDVLVTRRIGVLQDFYIHSMDSRRRQINLSNMARKQEDIFEDYKRTM